MIKNQSFFIISMVFLLLLEVGCVPREHKIDTYVQNSTLSKRLSNVQDLVSKLRTDEEKQLQKIHKKKEIEITPILPRFNPLENTYISLSVKDTPLSDILYVLAKNAGLNLIIEPGISPENRVTIEFENVPSNLVLDKLLQAYDLTYELKDNILYIKKYEEKIFKLDFLNTITEVSIDNGGDIFGALGVTSSSGGGSNMGRGITGKFELKTKLSNKLEKDSLYGIIENTVSSILGIGGSHAQSGTGVSNSGEKFVLDPVTGTLYVKASPDKIKAISRFLDGLKQKMKRQVVIDAQILEVTLNDNFRYGIDWNYLSNRLIKSHEYSLNIGISTRVQDNIPVTIIANKNPSSTLNSNYRLDSIVSALREFGNISIISNPHIVVRNSQPGLFTSGTSFRYVDSITREQSDTSTTYTVTPASVFNGIMLGVIPFIIDENTVNLQIFPIKSLVDENSLNLVDVTNGGDRISLPRVEVKNVNTNILAHNGDIIILGGLIDRVNNAQDKTVPILGNLPFLGPFFKSIDHREQIREMVIIMKVKIL